MEFLHHYTSIETLALILKSKKIRFNSLYNVDDPEEMETADAADFGRHCLVSCWTQNFEDILPLWNMYTRDMKGVRISMKKFPFKKYFYKKGEYGIGEDNESYIDMEKYFLENKVSIALGNPELVEVIYTDEVEKLHPQIKFHEDDGNKTKGKIHFTNIGVHKRLYWSFQKEWRYKIMVIPCPMREMTSMKTTEQMENFFSNVENSKVIYNNTYLELSDDAFSEMEILLGPKTSEAEETIVQALVDKFCSGNNVKVCKSAIRVR